MKVIVKGPYEKLQKIKGDMKMEKQKMNANELFLNIYVDGSHCSVENINGIGCVMVEDDKEIHTISKQTQGNDQWNVGAEIDSALTAVKWAIDNGYEEVIINYDYLGIEMWATGSWSAKNPITFSYARRMREAAQHIDIRFRKVKAHSGNFFNDLADKLARQAIGK